NPSIPQILKSSNPQILKSSTNPPPHPPTICENLRNLRFPPPSCGSLRRPAVPSAVLRFPPPSCGSLRRPGSISADLLDPPTTSPAYLPRSTKSPQSAVPPTGHRPAP